MASTKPYVALEPLGLGPFTLAFAVGSVVPDEVVESYGWQDKVARAGTKSAEAAATPEA